MTRLKAGKWWSTGTLVCLLMTGVAWGQAPSTPSDSAEGPLQNDTFVPTDRDAQETLLRGDQALKKSRAESSTRQLAEALDAWKKALDGAAPTAWVHGADAEGLANELWSARPDEMERVEFGIQAAVTQRLLSLGPSERQTWLDRFDSLAMESLNRFPFEPSHLQKVEFQFPCTTAAALASLRLADGELERGAPALAQTWLDRAAAHQAFQGLDAGWIDHLEARGWRASPKSMPPTPAGVQDLKTVRAVRLEVRPGSPPHGETPHLGLGLMPGLAPMPGGSVLVQTPRALLYLSSEYLDGEAGPVEALDLSTFTQEGPLRPLTPASSGGWPLTPITRGARAILVVDRARSGFVRYGLPIPSRSNHLICLEVGSDAKIKRIWQRSSEGLLGANGQWRSDVEPRGAWEFQPGPLWIDDLLICLARAIPEPDATQPGDANPAPNEAFLHLMAFRAIDGQLVYSVPFAKASDLVLRDDSSVSQGIPTVAMPLGFDPQSGQVLVSSHHGLISTFDAVDGRPRWSLRTRRRDPRAPGWPGSRRPPIANSIGWVAPFDSDFLYRLDLSREATSPLHAPPMAKGQRMDLVHADETGCVFLGRRGRSETLWYEPVSGAPQYSVFMGRQEHLTGTIGRTQDRWFFASTRGLYALDPARQWAMANHFPLEDLRAGIGGDVTPLGDRILVLGEDTLWVLR